MSGETQKWQEKDRRYVWHAMKGFDPDASSMVVAEASGSWITDTDGNRYLDGMSGQWCVNAGYGRDELVEAASAQMKTMPYYPLAQSHIPAIELGAKLNEWLDDEYVVFYTNSGSDANETAFKVSRQFHQQNGQPGRYKFVSRYRAYHGTTFASLAATGHAERKYRYEPLPPGFLHVAPPDRYRCAYCSDRPACNLQCAGEIERVIHWEMPETVAAVIMEPIITGGGMIFPPEGYVEEVARICQDTGALLIIDEVISGFGRTGKKFGYQHYGIKPDIVTMAKGLTSGYLPLAATAVRREFFERFAETEEYGRLRHISTFGGNPAACALAIRNLEILESEGLIERSAKLGEQLGEALSQLKDLSRVGDVRGRGLLFGIEVVEDKQSKRPASRKSVTNIVRRCKERALIVSCNFDTAPGFNNIITICPPLNTSEEDLSFLVSTLKEAI
ncbi:aspartate aminotransferase family protein [soil metagenome]